MVENIPAVVIVAVNVQHFLALHTEDSAKKILAHYHHRGVLYAYPDRTHSVKPSNGRLLAIESDVPLNAGLHTGTKDHNIVLGGDFVHNDKLFSSWLCAKKCSKIQQ